MQDQGGFVVVAPSVQRVNGIFELVDSIGPECNQPVEICPPCSVTASAPIKRPFVAGVELRARLDVRARLAREDGVHHVTYRIAFPGDTSWAVPHEPVIVELDRVIYRQNEVEFFSPVTNQMLRCIEPRIKAVLAMN